MRREVLEKLTAIGAADRPLVRALDVESGEEILIDPVTDQSPLSRAAAIALTDDTSRRVELDGRSWFLTVYGKPWELVIIGAVHIAQALAGLAGMAGYRVRVIDPRAAYAVPERFPSVRLIMSWPDEALVAEPLTAQSALVALSHDPKLDDPALATALRSPTWYIGALGSTRTHARRLARLGEQGFGDTECTRIHGPVGLAIGARSPAEIAISILAEMVKCRRAAKVPAPRIGGVVLAAGLSRRMGQNKLLAPLGGKPLVRHAVEAALASRLDPVIVVTGHDAEAVQAALDDLDVTFAHNAHFADGLSTSLQQGIVGLPADCEGAMVLLGDMPGVTTALINRIVAAFDPAGGRAICVAAARGRRGHPVLWGRQFFEEISALTGDEGARTLYLRHAAQICEIETADDAPFADIDTPEALRAYSARLQGVL